MERVGYETLGFWRWWLRRRWRERWLAAERQTSGGEFGASAPERGAVWKKLYYAGDDGALWITWTLRHGVL